MADVVICYAPDNQASARQLADAIRAEGWTVWYDDSPAAGSAGEALNRMRDRPLGGRRLRRT